MACREVFMFVVKPVKLHELVCPLCYTPMIVQAPSQQEQVLRVLTHTTP